MHVFLVFSGTNDRAVLTLIRAIKRLGERVVIIARGPSDNILLSAYKCDVLAIRENDRLTVEIIEKYIDIAKKITGADRFTCVPISEYFNTFLLQNRAAIELIDGCCIPLADASIYFEISNKRSAMDFFSRAGVRSPRTIASFDQSFIPFVAKPNENVRDGEVKYPALIKTLQDFEKFRSSERAENYFFQQFVTGRSFYILCFFSKSGSIYKSSQENLAQQPGGKSIVLAKTADFHHCADAIKAIDALAAAGFYGLAMMEFIVNEQGAFFIELNPRPWGPLDLCLNHECGLIEAFIGDCSAGDPEKFQSRRLSGADGATYLWLGGIVQILRRRKAIVHKYANNLSFAKVIMKNMCRDLYFKKDSWKIFIMELMK